MKLLLTGMTRDGVFWIENGEVKYGIKNMRFNESPFNLLKATRMNHFGKLAFEWAYWNMLLKGFELPVPTLMSMRGKKVPKIQANQT